MIVIMIVLVIVRVRVRKIKVRTAHFGFALSPPHFRRRSFL